MSRGKGTRARRSQGPIHTQTNTVRPSINTCRKFYSHGSKKLTSIISSSFQITFLSALFGCCCSMVSHFRCDLFHTEQSHIDFTLCSSHHKGESSLFFFFRSRSSLSSLNGGAGTHSMLSFHTIDTKDFSLSRKNFRFFQTSSSSATCLSAVHRLLLVH